MNSINSYRKAASLSFPKSPSRLFFELPFSLQQGLGAGIHVPRAGQAPMTGSLLSDTSRSQCWEEKQFRAEVPTLTLKTCHTHTHTLANFPQSECAHRQSTPFPLAPSQQGLPRGEAANCPPDKARLGRRGSRQPAHSRRRVQEKPRPGL